MAVPIINTAITEMLYFLENFKEISTNSDIRKANAVVLKLLPPNKKWTEERMKKKGVRIENIFHTKLNLYFS
jgi:hypothetical protein